MQLLALVVSYFVIDAQTIQYILDFSFTKLQHLQVANDAKYFLQSCLYLTCNAVVFRLMRPLSMVETRRGGSIPSWTLYLFHSLCLRCFVFSTALRNFHNWTFTLEQPDGCAATFFGMPLL